MSRIHVLGNGNCVARAISTMRAALGYRFGLPRKWVKLPIANVGTRSVSDIVAALPECFPRHKILIYCQNDADFSTPTTSRIDVLSDPYTYGPNQDKHLWAYAYQTTWNSGHMVVGNPTPDINVLLVFGVSLAKFRGSK